MFMYFDSFHIGRQAFHCWNLTEKNAWWGMFILHLKIHKFKSDCPFFKIRNLAKATHFCHQKHHVNFLTQPCGWYCKYFQVCCLEETFNSLAECSCIFYTLKNPTIDAKNTLLASGWSDSHPWLNPYNWGLIYLFVLWRFV